MILENNDTRLILPYVESLMGHWHDRVQTESQELGLVSTVYR